MITVVDCADGAGLVGISAGSVHYLARISSAKKKIVNIY